MSAANEAYYDSINSYATVSLTIEAGAVIDGITMSAITTNSEYLPSILIQSGGILQNSFIAENMLIESYLDTR